MKRAILVGAFAGLLVGGALGLAACQDPAPRHKIVRIKHTVHKMSDGRYAFQNDSGQWFWFVYSGTGSSRLDGGTLAMPGSWTVGGAPDGLDLSSAADLDIDIPTLDGASGAPISESQVASVEASVEAGGGMSEASAGPTDSSPSVDSSVDSGSSGGDSGSSGGGDSGGGGGD